ncbi:unnamed protein product [Penicillium pancosmium]
MDPFHDDSWATPWRSSEFPPEELPRERRKRFATKPGWRSGWNGHAPRFFQYHTGMAGGWPWGYVIYRTSFGSISDQDWAAVVAKIDRILSRFPFQPNIHELVREGYRNVIIEDPNLENASTDTIRKRHVEWVKERGYSHNMGAPRFDYCLVLNDRSIRSILASSEPDDKSNFGLVGYVNVIDCDFDPNDQENDCSELYDGSLRICLKELFCFASYCEDLQTREQQWGEWGMERPGNVIYTDGRCSIVEEEDVFLCSPDYSVSSRACYPEFSSGATITETQYHERQIRRSNFENRLREQASRTGNPTN